VVKDIGPTQRNENHVRRHPRESGGPLLVRSAMDSRVRGNDVIPARPLQIARRISTCVLNLVLPSGAMTLNPSFSNIDAVPCVDSFPKA